MAFTSTIKAITRLYHAASVGTLYYASLYPLAAIAISLVLATRYGDTAS